MLSLSPATRIFLALSPVDGRKSFNGPHILVNEVLRQEPTSGFLFVFTNNRATRLWIVCLTVVSRWRPPPACLKQKPFDRG
ncbi:MAG: IS66 family insertion sequence element accessory protein TnpB [Verrucomicrobia bacterium]|nr:IS66 family insertion sequence element accessory protein TnpB [Verrucomicrobiota bacterium]MBI3869445.1 IS66 family insertion sequence element accessory protein TnpB [Verrucomicrobiota bacterium]